MTEEYKDLFISEAKEILRSLNTSLVLLEKNPAETEHLHEIFRQAHSLKGMSASMGYEMLTHLTHEMESLLDLLRSGKIRVEKTIVDLLFDAFDLLELLIEEVVESGEKKKKEKRDLEPAISQIVLSFEKIKQPGSKKSIPFQPSAGQKEVSKRKVKPVHPEKLRTIRVPMKRLDHLMNLAGELVIQKASLTRMAHALGDKQLDEIVAQTGRLIEELQLEAMQVRLVPLEYIFSQFPRVVRDLAGEASKEVNLVIEGADIGLDRTILDEIHEPLVHLLRNAVSHGIETPEIRRKLGKNSAGVIHLSARRERNYVVIEVSDDGKGMNIQEVRKIAVERGRISEEEVSKLSDEEVLMLITQAGFSTSSVVTKTQGRGVGLDSVRTIVESFGGTMNVSSALQKGSTFTLHLPVSMAIVQALLARVSDETYAIPLINVLETLKVSSDLIREVEHQEVIYYRDTVLPLVTLRGELGFEEGNGKKEKVSVIVVQVGRRRAGLIVDHFLTQQEIVIKSLADNFKAVRGISGATILGDGKVAMIVDVGSLIG